MDKTVALALLGFIIATGVTMGLYQINFQRFTPNQLLEEACIFTQWYPVV